MRWFPSPSVEFSLSNRSHVIQNTAIVCAFSCQMADKICKLFLFVVTYISGNVAIRGYRELYNACHECITSNNLRRTTVNENNKTDTNVWGALFKPCATVSVNNAI